MQVYVNKDGQQYGPFTVEQLRQYVQQGNFTTTDFACCDGQNWITIGQVPGFDAEAQAVQQQTPTSASSAKKKKVILWSSIGGGVLVVAALLIWMLGGAGDDVDAFEPDAKQAAKPLESDKPNPSVPKKEEPPAKPKPLATTPEAKIKRIEIPAVDFIEKSLPDALEALATYSRQNDFQSEEDAKGVEIIFKKVWGYPDPFSPVKVPLVTIQLEKMSLEKMLDAITSKLGWQYEATSDEVIVSKEPVENKLKRIEIPGVNFFETPMQEVMDTLMAYSRANDHVDPDPDTKGVMIYYDSAHKPDPFGGGSPVPRVTISLRKMTLEKMLDFITESVACKYEVKPRSGVVVISKETDEEKRRRIAKSRGLEIAHLEPSLEVLDQMAGIGPKADQSPPAAPDPFLTGPGNMSTSEQEKNIKAFVLGSGIDINEGKGHALQFDGFGITFTNSLNNVEKLKKLIERLEAEIEK